MCGIWAFIAKPDQNQVLTDQQLSNLYSSFLSLKNRQGKEK